LAPPRRASPEAPTGSCGAIFDTAVADELIGKDPCRIRGAGVDRAPERSIPTVPEVAALADAIDPSLRGAVLLAAWGTRRRGEVLGLRRGDVDVDRATVHVQRSLTELRDGRVIIGPPKTKASNRLVYHHDPVAAAVADHFEHFVAADPVAPVFPAHGGMHLRPTTFSLAWDAARRAVGLRHVRFHDLRPFAGTMPAATGASTRELMARGGWSTVAMVTHHQHATADRDAFLARAMAPFVDAGPSSRPANEPDRVPQQPAAGSVDEPSTGDPGTHSPRGDRNRSRTARARRRGTDGATAHRTPPARGNGDASSGGETRTLNLAVNSRLLCH